MLTRVTITGADDHTSVPELVELSQEFPFVEWGILVSKRQEGSTRFPSRKWISTFEDAAEQCNLNVSTHMCGLWVRQLLTGTLDWNELPESIGVSRRVQIWIKPFRGMVRMYRLWSAGLLARAKRNCCSERHESRDTMATKVQKKVLWWMIDNGGELYISTGNKRVLYAHTNSFGKDNEMFCKGNENLVHGLLDNGYAERMFKYPDVWNYRPSPEEQFMHHRFKITDKGRKAAGKTPA